MCDNKKPGTVGHNNFLGIRDTHFRLTNIFTVQFNGIGI